MHQVMDLVMKDLAFQTKTTSSLVISVAAQNNDDIVVVDEAYVRERLK